LEPELQTLEAEQQALQLGLLPELQASKAEQQALKAELQASKAEWQTLKVGHGGVDPRQM